CSVPAGTTPDRRRPGPGSAPPLPECQPPGHHDTSGRSPGLRWSTPPSIRLTRKDYAGSSSASSLGWPGNRELGHVERNHPVVVTTAPVDDRGTLALLVHKQVEIVAHQFHLIQRLVQRHRSRGVGLLPDYQRTVAGNGDRSDLPLLHRVLGGLGLSRRPVLL